MVVAESYFSEWKLKKDFGAAFRYFFTHLFCHCHVTFPYKEILSFVGHCHMTFPCMQPLSFFGRFLQKVIVSVFQIHLFRKRRNYQMAAIVKQSIPSYYTKFSEKSSSVSARTYEKHIVFTDYCITHHDDRTCFLPTCKYHIILHGNVEELLKKLDIFCFTFQHVDCLYTLFKYRFSGKVIAKSGQVFNNVQRAVDFNQKNKGVALRKRDSWGKITKLFIQLLSKDKSNAD